MDALAGTEEGKSGLSGGQGCGGWGVQEDRQLDCDRQLDSGPLPLSPSLSIALFLSFSPALCVCQPFGNTAADALSRSRAVRTQTGRVCVCEPKISCYSLPWECVPSHMTAILGCGEPNYKIRSAGLGPEGEVSRWSCIKLNLLSIFHIFNCHCVSFPLKLLLPIPDVLMRLSQALCWLTTEHASCEAHGSCDISQSSLPADQPRPPQLVLHLRVPHASAKVRLLCLLWTLWDHTFFVIGYMVQCPVQCVRRTRERVLLLKMDLEFYCSYHDLTLLKDYSSSRLAIAQRAFSFAFLSLFAEAD